MSKTIKVKSSENKKDWPIITVFSSVSPEAPKGFKDTCLRLGEETKECVGSSCNRKASSRILRQS